MSDTPKLADECQKLLDNGWAIVLYQNGMGSYSAVALSREASSDVLAAVDIAVEDYEEEGAEQPKGVVLTDDFTPSQVLYRVTEKVFGKIV